MQKHFLISTNGFATINIRHKEECCTINIKSCVGIAIKSSKNKIITLAHIPDFHLKNEDCLKNCLQDILNDFKKSGKNLKHTTIELCGYKANIDLVEKNLRKYFVSFNNIVKHKSNFEEVTNDYRNSLSMCVNENGDIVILEGYPYYLDKLKCLNANNCNKNDIINSENLVKNISQEWIEGVDCKYRKSLNEWNLYDDKRDFYKNNAIENIRPTFEYKEKGGGCVIS